MNELALPAQLGPYELLVRLGSGSMASVYLARLRGEAGFSRAYAVKVIHPHLSQSRELVDMLMDEARMAGRLSHPNVVATLDLGREGNTCYLVMEYVDGVALERLLVLDPTYRPPELLVSIAIDALRGLQTAHELCDHEGHPLELVHRDVAPGNVMVTLDGGGLIADFGMAKARTRITKTNPGIVKGKAGYVAPEIVLGRPIDGRADVFSMGVTLYNALTGTTLFDTVNIASSLTALLRGDVSPPSTLGLRPPAIFDGPILTALRREPSERHASAADFADTLSSALSYYQVPAEPARIGAWVGHRFGNELEALRDLTAPEPDPDIEIGPVRADATRPVRRPPRVITRPKPEAIAQKNPAAPRSSWLLFTVVLLVSLLVGAAVAYFAAASLAALAGPSS